jgi:hypothetical protein
MVCGLSACDVWPVACTANEPSRSLLVVCQFLRWDEIFRVSWVLFEHCQKLGSLLIAQQTESNRCNQVVAALGPCVGPPRQKDEKSNENFGCEFHEFQFSRMRIEKTESNLHWTLAITNQ